MVKWRLVFEKFDYYLGVSKNRGGPPKWMVKIMVPNPLEIHDLGVQFFLETPICFSGTSCKNCIVFFGGMEVESRKQLVIELSIWRAISEFLPLSPIVGVNIIIIRMPYCSGGIIPIPNIRSLV